jgi:RNA polymerase sigma factor (sigma-70 family)
MELHRAERDAFDAFVAPHLRVMWVLASRLVGPEAREDVVQEALLTAWRRFSTYDPARGSARTWLLVLVADRCRKHRRRTRPTVELVDVGVASDVEGHLDLSRAVAALPRRQRLAVELHYVLGLPMAECAAVMGCATGTVTSTLSDARAALRTRLEVTS